MAINKVTMKASVRTALTAADFNIATSKAVVLADILVDVIMDEITTNAEVTTNVTGTLPDGAEAASGEGGIT